MNRKRNRKPAPNRRAAPNQNRHRDGELVTASGFRFTPPPHLLDDWDFLASISRLAGSNREESEVMADYFSLAETFLGPDGLERLKQHVTKTTGYPSFESMRQELEELMGGLKQNEGN